MGLMAELLEMLEAHGNVEQADSMTVSVDIQDLAAFTSEVKALGVFTVCMESAQLVPRAGGLRLKMTARNWHRVHFTSTVDDQLPQMSHAIKQLLRKNSDMQEALRRITGEVCSPAAEALCTL